MWLWFYHCSILMNILFILSMNVNKSFHVCPDKSILWNKVFSINSWIFATFNFRSSDCRISPCTQKSLCRSLLRRHTTQTITKLNQHILNLVNPMIAICQRGNISYELIRSLFDHVYFKITYDRFIKKKKKKKTHTILLRIQNRGFCPPLYFKDRGFCPSWQKSGAFVLRGFCPPGLCPTFESIENATIWNLA